MAGTIIPIIAASKIRSDIPAPGPVPTSPPKMGARFPFTVIAGSNNRSLRGPAIKAPNGIVSCPVNRRAAKTRPCTSAGVFACHIAWLDELHTAIKNTAKNPEIDHATTSCPSPIPARPTLTSIKPPNTPSIFRLGPPQILIIRPPATPPIAVIDATVPRMASLLPVRARIMGVRNTAPIASKLTMRKLICRPSKLGFARK